MTGRAIPIGERGRGNISSKGAQYAQLVVAAELFLYSSEATGESAKLGIDTAAALRYCVSV
jgi:hypothetical protein